MDAMAYLRLKNIMGGQDEEDAPNDMANSYDDGMYGGNDVDSGTSNTPLPSMSDLYHPSNVANGALTSHLNAMPNRDDFHASIGRKVLAGIAGLGAGAGPAGISGGSPVGFRGNSEAAYKTANGIVNAPYNQSLDDWDNKLKPLEVNAKLEDNDNTNNRIAANNTMSRAISDKNANTRQEDEKRKAKNDEETKRHHEQNEKAAQDRIAAKNFANDPKNAKMKSFTGKDGYIYFYNPTDTSGKSIKTDILSKDMNDFDKLAIRHDNTMSEIDRRSSNASDLEDKKQKGRIEVKTTAAPAKAVSPGSTTKETTKTTIGPDGKTRITEHERATTPNQPGSNGKQPDNQVEKASDVPKEKRVIGKNYRLANGTIGRWVGTGFTAVQ